MMQNMAWVAGLVTVAFAVGCGDTSNFVGEEPNGGSAGSGAGSAGKAGGGASSGGTGNPQAGTKNGGGSGSGSGGAGTGGTAPNGGSGGSTGGADPTDDCKELSGNWLSCDGGLVHRDKPGTCQNMLPRPNAIPATSSGSDECTKDSECTEKPNGYCTLLQGGFVPVQPHNICDYGCSSDADCTDTQICQCGAFVGKCAASGECGSDQDCQGGMLCTNFDSCPGVPAQNFACQKPADECKSNADCTEPMKQFCSMDGDHRACVGVRCAAGAGQ